MLYGERLQDGELEELAFLETTLNSEDEAFELRPVSAEFGVEGSETEVFNHQRVLRLEEVVPADAVACSD